MNLSEATASPADDLISSKWNLAILRILACGPQRFCNLKSQIPKISANVLTRKLRTLEDFGAIERVNAAEAPERLVYRLSARGQPVCAVIEAIDQWQDGAQQ